MLSMFVAYRDLADYPGKFVLRKLFFTLGDQVELELKSELVAVCDDLEEARSQVPGACVCFGRDPNDDPTIVEVWI